MPGHDSRLTAWSNKYATKVLKWILWDYSAEILYERQNSNKNALENNINLNVFDWTQNGVKGSYNSTRCTTQWIYIMTSLCLTLQNLLRTTYKCSSPKCYATRYISQILQSLNTICSVDGLVMPISNCTLMKISQNASFVHCLERWKFIL